MQLHAEFPDAEALLVQFVASVLAVPVFAEEPDTWNLDPDQLVGDVPCAVVERIPGPGSGREFESTPLIEITLYHLDRARLFTELVAPLERALPALPLRVGVVDEISIPQTFGVVSYANRAVRKGVGRVQLVTRPAR